MAKPSKSYKFKIDKGVDVPEGRTGRTPSHRFPWDDLKPGDSFLVPKSYWIERGDKPNSYDPNKVRERIRANFRLWQAKDRTRAKYILRMATLPSGDIRVGLRKA